MLGLFELLGTIAFAVSGAMTGLSKKMDIFGVTILGVVTSVGGGVIRDLILGKTPPATFKNPTYALFAIAVSIIIFIPMVRRFLFKKQHIYDAILLLMDSVGLGAFTVVGIQVAYTADSSYNLFLLVFVGVVTGVGGGIIRDILAGNTPYIFVKHFYACASIIGSLACIVLWKYIGQSIAIIGGATIVVILRLLAAHFRWSLPKAELE